MIDAALDIPRGILVLMGLTLAVVLVLTVAARIVDRLWPAPRNHEPEPRRRTPGQRARSRVALRVPATIGATLVAAALLLGLAWSVTLILRAQAFF